MANLRKRMEKAERALNINQEHITENIVWYGGELPPDRTEGNINIHYVKYDEKANQ